MHSGSAAVDVFNTSGWGADNNPPLVLAYTASAGNGGSDKIQMQCIAYSTDGGRNYAKYENNPVLGHEQRFIKDRRGDPNARDPKIFWFSPTKGRDAHAKDGYWVMVLFEQRGHTIYTSPDLKEWTKTGAINGFHECPELFPLAVDGDPENVKWVMYGAKGRYHIGSFNGKAFKPETKKQTDMYYGDKCYASQTFNNTKKGPDGQPRRIQTSWQGGRFGQLSLPVELTLKTTPLGERVCMLPAPEITNLYTDSVKLDGLTITPGMANPLAGQKSGLYDIEIEADLSEASQLELNVRGNKFVITSHKNGLKLGKMIIPGSKKLFLRMVVDHTSQDIFFGEHGAFYSPRMVPPTSDKTLSIATKGGSVTFSKLRVHQLKSIW